MKPATAEWLERMRYKGRKPAMVIIEVDRNSPSEWFAWRETWGVPVLSLASFANVERLDLRVLVGLSVTIIADSYSDWLWRLWGKVKDSAPAYAATVVREWASDGGDFGWHWSAAAGDRSLLEASA